MIRALCPRQMGVWQLTVGLVMLLGLLGAVIWG